MRFAPLLAALSLGVLGTLAAGRALQAQLPPPTPDNSTASLALLQHWSLDPWRRREAALLRAGDAGDPRRRLRLLAGQGWGQGPLAAVALKQQALAAEAAGQPHRATSLWQGLRHRLPHEPASAEALYALGRHQPQLRRELLQRWPAHPAALAAASEQSSVADALHLARWGARWPGAQARMQAACGQPGLQPSQRQQLAQGLGEIGASAEALHCLGPIPALPSTTLLLAESELLGSSSQQRRGISRLQSLIQAAPRGPATAAAVRLLAEQGSPAALQALSQLPPTWRQSAVVQAALAQQHGGLAAALAVLRRWPADPASWELQWQRARQAALAGRWSEARTLLAAGGPRLEATMPLTLQMRRRFWWGLSDWQLGQRQAGRQQWRRIQRQDPGGYYGWRAALRLGQRPPATSTAAADWSPLDSGDLRIDQLWRLGQPLEAWEAWRASRRGRPPRSSAELQAEGRLREAIGDGWIGLGQQELAARRLPVGQCRLQQRIHSALYTPRQLEALGPAARQSRVPLPLLLGLSLQESRFQSAASSVVGATGLMQLMPETAAEVAGTAVSRSELANPRRNAQLGARYLAGLLQRWSNNPLLAVASYNAGPNAVARWQQPSVLEQPELWVEAIPYPETRYYVKAVLGNSWSFGQRDRLGCH